VRTFSLAAISLAAVLAAACGDDGRAAPATTPPAATRAPSATASPAPVVELRYPGGTLHVELADTAAARSVGLGGRDVLAPDAGMLFDLGTTRVPTFSMRGMRFPLDMIWIDADKRIVAVTPDVPVQPADEPRRTYSPPRAVRYVLELNAGAAARLGLGPGLQLQFDAQP